ncbi:MAG: YceI family protein [Opitutales bacterium]
MMRAWIIGLASVSFALAAEGQVALDVDKERSRISAFVRATGHTFDAVVTDYQLDLQWDPDSGEIVSAQLVFDFDDVETGRTTRDREMREWLDYETYPMATFELNEVDVQEGLQIAGGHLTLHGVEQEIESPFSVQETTEGVWITGQTVIDHREWGLERIRAFLFLTVDPELEVRFRILATPPEEFRPPGDVGR